MATTNILVADGTGKYKFLPVDALKGQQEVIEKRGIEDGAFIRQITVSADGLNLQAFADLCVQKFGDVALSSEVQFEARLADMQRIGDRDIIGGIKPPAL